MQSGHASAIPQYQADGRYKIAIIQPACYGDNINSTLMFKPLLAKYPNCLLDIHTSSPYACAFYNNPYVNNIIEYYAKTKEESLHLVRLIPPQIATCGYDKIYNPHPLINPTKWTSTKSNLGTNLICAWVRALEDDNVEYQLPLETILRLTEEETQKVARYCEHVPQMNQRRNVLMETTGESGQTFFTPEWTLRIGKHLLDGNTNLFISRKEFRNDIEVLSAHAPGCVHFVGGLSLRDCAELFNRCQVFFSVSSGLSNFVNSSWCKKDIQWFEITNSSVASSAAVGPVSHKTFYHDNNLEGFIDLLKAKGI